MKKDVNLFNQLVGIMARLRAPDGCPWDRKQNHRSLLPYLIEECYEVVDTIEKRQYRKLKEELGDLLLQIIFHAQLATERQQFTIYESIADLKRKLIERHPHVFGPKKRISAKQVLHSWERLKLKDRPDNNRSVLAGVPTHLPALLKAFRVQEKVARFGFEWERIPNVFEKIREELAELESAQSRRKKLEMEAELGELLFVLVTLARKLRIDPETALRKAVAKFCVRFEFVEWQLKKRGQDLAGCDSEEIERLWHLAKVPSKRKRKYQ